MPARAERGLASPLRGLSPISEKELPNGNYQSQQKFFIIYGGRAINFLLALAKICFGKFFLFGAYALLILLLIEK